MEKYQNFLGRIGEFEIPDMDLGKSYFNGRASLADKIDEDNRLRGFYGDTVVFELDDDVKNIIGKMIDEVYEAASGCFAERLDNQTLHMTLHDLSNSKSLCDVNDAMEENLSKIRDRLDEFQEYRIKMKTNCIFNMVNTSLVMGLVPVDENEHDKLMRLWNIIDGVKKSPYPLTPHITLGYYNVHGFSAENIRRLEKIVGELNRRGKIYITLDTKKLFYQRFKSMNKYENVLGLIQQ